MTFCASSFFQYQSVNKPKDWYKSMFRQIHKKPEGKDTPPSPSHTQLQCEFLSVSVSGTAEVIQQTDYCGGRKRHDERALRSYVSSVY